MTQTLTTPDTSTNKAVPESPFVKMVTPRRTVHDFAIAPSLAKSAADSPPNTG
jgi:hypothetical protein